MARTASLGPLRLEGLTFSGGTCLEVDAESALFAHATRPALSARRRG